MAGTRKARPHNSISALPATPPVSPEALHDLIRARACQLYQQRAGGPGDPESDWLQAEREIQSHAVPPEALQHNSHGEGRA